MRASIKSGQRYKITDEQNKLIVDLSGANKSIIGYNFHGGANQQRSRTTANGLFFSQGLGFETNPDDGTLLISLDEPQLWDVEILPDHKDSTKPSVKLYVRDTCFVIDLPLERPVVGTDLQL